MRIKQLFISILFSIVCSQSLAQTLIKHWQTSQGGEVYFVSSPGLPMVDIRILFDAGSARDGKYAGLASLTTSLLETGAGKSSADQLAQALDALGAQYSYGTNRDYSWLGLRSLTQADLLTPALATFQKIMSQPQFAVDEFQRIKDQRLIGLRQQQEKPGHIANKAFYQAIYGEHPYAHLETGTIESITALQVNDVKQFYQQYYVSKNAVLAIVGDLSEDQARQTAETLFAQLRLGEKAQAIPTVTLPMSDKKQPIAFTSMQTHILAGLPVLKRKDPDYFPLYVGNHILGGSGLVSKLFGEIREKRGLAYSAYSYFSPLAQAGPFTLGLQTQNKQSETAIEVMLNTLKKFINEGPSQEELDAALKNLTGGFVLRFDNNKKLLNYVAMIAFYDLPLNYLDAFPDKVAQVTLEEIKSAFQRRVKMNQLQVISVGGQ